MGTANHILALDQGTTSSRAMVFDQDAREVSVAHQPTTQIYPHPGWVNQDAAEIWLTTLQTAREALQQAGLSGDLAGIGIVNQRNTRCLGSRRVHPCRSRLAEPPEPATDRGAADAGHGAGLRKQDGLGPRRLFHGVETCLAP